MSNNLSEEERKMLGGRVNDNTQSATSTHSGVAPIGKTTKGGTMDKKQMVQIIVIACVISCFLIGLACTIIGAAQDMDSVAICAIVFMLVAAASITIHLILDNVKKSAVSCSLQIFIIIFAVLSTVVFFGLAVAAVA